MSELCTDNRFEVIEFYKKQLIESTNIETSPKEMAVIDTVLFRFWQMGWLVDTATVDTTVYSACAGSPCVPCQPTFPECKFCEFAYNEQKNQPEKG